MRVAQKTLFLTLIATVALPGVTPALAKQSQAGRAKTDRSIVMNYVVAAPIDRVYELWTTEAGAKSFFGEDAAIEARKGGKYEIYFLPRNHPESDANSSKGARVLWIESNRGLAFEWTAPPFAAHLNTNPLPLWIEIDLVSLERDPSFTVVHLASHGYGRGEYWDPVYEFFVRAWSDVLYRLDRTIVDPGFDPAW